MPQDGLLLQGHGERGRTCSEEAGAKFEPPRKDASPLATAHLSKAMNVIRTNSIMPAGPAASKELSP